jgi:hypothetical protein
MSRPGNYAERQARNEESKSWAEHDREPWSADEYEQLTEYWDGSEETLTEIARLLGRTIEACRERYYKLLKAEGQGHVTIITRTVTRGWLIGYCFECGRHGDVYSDGVKAKCEDCRG